MIKKLCLVCGTEFKTKPSITKIGSGKYCSRECVYKSQKNKIKKICLTCKKKFLTHPSKIKKGGGKYCSAKCYNKSKENRVQVTCQICREIFKVRPSVIKKGNGKYCSVECCSKAYIGRHHTEKTREKMREVAKRRRGNKNGNWIDGRSFEPYTSEFNNQLKELIRLRDGYKCQKCGCPELECNRKLDVHHIDYNKKNCLPENLITLCKKCNIPVDLSGLPVCPMFCFSQNDKNRQECKNYSRRA